MEGWRATGVVRERWRLRHPRSREFGLL